MMERLTNNTKLGFQDSNKLPSYESLWDRLRYYEDLEESGKLIVLPCKIGDIVNNFNEDKEIVSMTITEIYPFGESSFDCESQLPTIHNICLEDEDWNEYYLSFEDFNISINEAEEKLKEME